MVVLGRSAFLKKSLAKTDLVDPACSGHSPREKKVGKEKRDNKVLRCRTLDRRKPCLGKVLRGGCRRQAEQNYLSPVGREPNDWRKLQRHCSQNWLILPADAVRDKVEVKSRRRRGRGLESSTEPTSDDLTRDCPQCAAACYSPAGRKPGDWRSGVDPPGECIVRQGRR